MLSAVFNTFPNLCFGQNNDVIQLTGVASRYVGFVVVVVLIALGLFPAVSSVCGATHSRTAAGRRDDYHVRYHRRVGRAYRVVVRTPQLSARSLTLNGVQAQNVLVQGKINNQALTLNNLGADLYQGELTGTAQHATNGSWQVDSLAAEQRAFAVGQDAAQRADLIDARMVGRNWAFNDLDLTLRDMTFQDGDWSAQDSSLFFNASDLINGGVHLTDILANMTFRPRVLRSANSAAAGSEAYCAPADVGLRDPLYQRYHRNSLQSGRRDARRPTCRCSLSDAVISAPNNTMHQL